MKKEKFFRNCPDCKKELFYTNKGNRTAAEKRGSVCRQCDDKARSLRMKGDGNPFYGKRHSKAILEQIQKNTDRSIFKTKEFKEKMSKVTSGKNNPMYGKTVYGVWLEKYGKEEADRRDSISREKHSKASSGKNNPMYGKPSPQGSGNGWSGWYKGWFFRSIRELSYMVNIIEANNLKWRSAETKDLAIRYVSYDGNERTYRADFLIDEKELVEVKPKKLFDTPKNVLKKEAAIKFCKSNNYTYSIVDVEPLDIDDMISLYDTKQIKFTKKYEEKYKQFIK